MPVRGSSEGSEDNQDDGRDEQRVHPGPAIGEIAKEQLADDGASKGDRRDLESQLTIPLSMCLITDIVDGRGVGVCVWVLQCQDRAHGSNDIVYVAITEETGAACKDGNEACACRLGCVKRPVVVCVDGAVLCRVRLLPKAKHHRAEE